MRRGLSWRRLAGGVGSLLGALLVVAVLAFALTNHYPDINGVTGITVDAQGRPIAVAELCRGSVNEMDLAGPLPQNGGRNPIYADLKTSPRDYSFTLDPAAPGSDWTGQQLSLPMTDELHILSFYNGKKSQLLQATFTPQDLAALQIGKVQYDTGSINHLEHTVVDMTDFHRIACDVIARRAGN